MRVGILSDTHDNLPMIQKAVDFFNREKVDFVLHAGDYVAPFSIKYLDKLSCDWIGVFGNNDGEKQGLKEKSGGRIKKPPLRISLSGRGITLVHDIKTISVAGERSQVIIFGHTHTPQIARKSKVLLINPGECSGWLQEKATVAILDLSDLSARIFAL